MLLEHHLLLTVLGAKEKCLLVAVGLSSEVIVRSANLTLVTRWRGEMVEMPCVACRCMVLPNLQQCVLLTTYGGPPATLPGPLPLLRVTSPDCLTRSYPHCHNVQV